MRRPLRLLSALLAFCVIAAAFPPVGRAAGGTIHSVPPDTDLITYLASGNVSDGDTLVLEGDVRAKGDKVENPWIISKSITINGNGNRLFVKGTGVLLGADVKFQNVDLHLESTDSRNAIIANGYALTLDSVTAGSGARSINVFGGTLLKADYETYFEVPPPGRAGEITIQGNTKLQNGNSTDPLGPANIFAGSLSMGNLKDTLGAEGDGPESEFNLDVSINIEDSAGPGSLGTIYAGGGQQRLPAGASSGKVTSPDPVKYRTGGIVTIQGANDLPNVDGAGADVTNVVYRGNKNPASKTLTAISSLAVESGNLGLTGESWLQNQGTLSVAPNARLDLKAFGSQNFDVGSFDSQGCLYLNADQTWYIDGAVTGKTTVVIDYMSAYGDGYVSAGRPQAGHVYIQAPNSQDGNFVLLPSSSDLNMTLERDGSGNWTARSGGTGGEDKVIVESFGFSQASVAEPSGETEIYIPLKATYADNSASISYLDFIPLYIEVNGRSAAREEKDGQYIYTCADTLTGAILSLQIIQDELQVCDNRNAYIPDGTYRIELKIPKEYNTAGTLLTAFTTLTVGGETPPAPISIDIPKAKTGLVWTGAVQIGVEEGEGYTLTGHTGTSVGSYTASATLKDGYQWTGGSTEEQKIPWTIGKAPGPSAPAGLSGTASSSEAAADGKITGTTAEMEYASTPDFADAKPCGEGETIGLTAGTYYVRYKETPTHRPGASTFITVLAPGEAAVTGISIKTPAVKTEYRTGERLDLTGLTIEVSYSDGTRGEAAVTENMVGGFDSSQAAESQTLTITYEGHRVTYTIKITASEQAATYRLTVGNTGSGGTAAGTYEYEEGATVAVQAGNKNGYAFAAWDAAGVELANRGVPDVSFQMPGNDVNLHVIWKKNDTPPSGHAHSWSSAWQSSGSHHWHDCSASGCPIAQNSQKSGYAPHTAGAWVVDRPATSSQNGLRHRSCTVCGYEMAREAIPATGGSSGGGSSGSGSSGSGSSGSSSGSSSGGSSSTSSMKNPDGSTTSTTTNLATGTVTETTRRPDGSKLVVETKKDGTVTSTETAKDGSTVKTVERPGGVVETTVNQAGGLTASVQEDGSGARADVRLPAATVRESQSSGAAVVLPIPALPGNSASLTVHTGSVRLVRVDIPARGNEDTTVAYFVNGDGSETMIKTAVLSGGRITVSVPNGATVRLRDNGKDFYDTQGHWAEDAIGFVTARELFSGKTSAAFSPDTPMTRAMLMTVLARLDGADAAGGYEKGMAWAVARGVSDGRNPGGAVTREQFVAMLHRYAGSPAATERELRFSDAEAVSAYAREAARWAVENGIISGYGDNSFAPGGWATRAQAAAMLTRYVNYLKNQ